MRLNSFARHLWAHRSFVANGGGPAQLLRDIITMDIVKPAAHVVLANRDVRRLVIEHEMSDESWGRSVGTHAPGPHTGRG